LRERGSNFPLFHWLALSSLKHSGTTVPACDTVLSQNIHFLCFRARAYKQHCETEWSFVYLNNSWLLLILYASINVCTACDLNIPTKFNSSQITPTQLWRHNDFWGDGGHGVANFIPVACLLTALVWYTSIHGRIITTSGLRNKWCPYSNFRYIPFTIWPAVAVENNDRSQIQFSITSRWMNSYLSKFIHTLAR